MNIKKILLTMALVTMVTPVLAQEAVQVSVEGGAAADTTATPPRPLMMPLRKAAAGIRLGARADAQATTTQFKEDRKEDRADFMGQKQEDRKEMVGDKQENREELKTGAAAIRGDATLSAEKKSAALEMLRNKFLSDQAGVMKEFAGKREVARKEFEKDRVAARAELKVKLAGIKDAKKKAVAAETGDKFNEVNAKLTEQVADNVTKIENVLGKISARADELALAGTEETAARAAIATATTQIATARAAITVQTAKTYAVTVTTEANLKVDFSATRDQLKKDIDALRAVVDAARAAVRSAALLVPAPAATVQATTTVQ